MTCFFLIELTRMPVQTEKLIIMTVIIIFFISHLYTLKSKKPGNHITKIFLIILCVLVPALILPGVMRTYTAYGSHTTPAGSPCNNFLHSTMLANGYSGAVKSGLFRIWRRWIKFRVCFKNKPAISRFFHYLNNMPSQR